MPLLVVLFIVVPLVELYLIIQVGQEIGALPTIALLVAASIFGSVLMRRQGRAAWRDFNAAVAAGRPPAREVLDGALIIFGGALLLTPGFATDVLGLLLLLPPTRAAIRRFLVARLIPGPLAFGLRRMARRGARGRAPGPSREPYVDGSAREVDDDPPRLP